jgi:hypothetical protein
MAWRGRRRLTTRTLELHASEPLLQTREALADGRERQRLRPDPLRREVLQGGACVPEVGDAPAVRRHPALGRLLPQGHTPE